MANHITELNVSSFRGIKNLALNNLSDINIIVGENNSGKTSLLEALVFFCNPTEHGIFGIAQQRTGLQGPFSIIENLRYLFNKSSKDDENSKLSITGKHKKDIIQVDLQGSFDRELNVQQNVNIQNPHLQNSVPIKEEVIVFNGNISTLTNNIETLNVNIKLSKFEITRNSLVTHIRLTGLTPMNYLFMNSYSNLIQKKELKDKAVKLLQYFDSSIKDIRLILSDINEMVVALESDKADYIPLSFYGDGIKKALALLDTAIMAENGVLLIDEFETALHTSLMQEVFHFLITVAQELNIQLFMTTHSLEAVDKLLEASQEHLDKVRVIRLANREDKTYAGIIDGHKAYKSRTVYGMELRG